MRKSRNTDRTCKKCKEKKKKALKSPKHPEFKLDRMSDSQSRQNMVMHYEGLNHVTKYVNSTTFQYCGNTQSHD